MDTAPCERSYIPEVSKEIFLFVPGSEILSRKPRPLNMKAWLAFGNSRSIGQWHRFMYRNNGALRSIILKWILYFLKSKATYLQEFQNKNVVICFNNDFHNAKPNPTKVQASSMSWRQQDVHWIRSGKGGIYRMIWCRASFSVTVEKKATLLEGTIHQNQLISCRSSARKPAYLYRIFYSYVINTAICGASCRRNWLEMEERVLSAAEVLGYI
jgi:hypothetical protein